MEKENTTQKYTMKGSSLWGVLLFGILLLIDMVTKIVADAYFSENPRIVLIPEYLSLCISYNKGIAFSIGAGADKILKIGLIVATSILFVAFSVYYFKMDKRRTWVRVALVFIIAGGVGNLIDRVYYRFWDPAAPFGVRDMVQLKILIFDFGVCNFADFFIVGGGITLMVGVLFFDATAIFPLTKKYKALCAEYEAKEEARLAEKKAKKANKTEEKKE